VIAPWIDVRVSPAPSHCSTVVLKRGLVTVSASAVDAAEAVIKALKKWKEREKCGNR
jgi:hypothetical protein